MMQEGVKMKKYKIKLNGKVYEIEMEEVIGDETGEVAAALAENIKPAQATIAPQPVPQSVPVTGGFTVEAPMPGTIVGVSVKAGDQVKTGQLLVVLEAMKMENEIVSSADGKILSVSVSKGQTVNAGEVLVEIG
jgi:glutaconyl-CoA/methylmalonyl-CoA decarboxylase subunit gamma